MKISDILKEKRTISFEFYPPKAADGIPAVLKAIDQVKAFEPDFVSITYGAGGATRSFTEEITLKLKKEAAFEVMAHLTCAGQTREEVHEVLERLNQGGLENIIALRGDPPRGQQNFVPAQGGFSHATDLIEHIRGFFQFGVAGASYPEGHPESPDLATDIKYSKLKVDAGADFLITQFFYDNSDFFALMERARRAGIEVPIIPGVLPILNAAQVRRFTALCGAKIPPALDKELDRLGEDDDAVRELGIEQATRQIRELWDNGVPGVHFYALNRSYSIAKILSNLGLPGHTGDT